MNRFAAVFFCLAMVAAAAAEPPQVSVETIDGNVVAGTLGMETIRIVTASGAVELNVAEILAIEFRGTEADVSKRDGTKVSGKPEVASWRVSSPKLGNLDLKTASLKKIAFVWAAGKPPPPTGPPGTGEIRPKVEVLGEWRAGTWALGPFAAAPDGASFWVLDGGARKMVRFGFDPLKPIGEIKLPADLVFNGWSASPSGKTAMVLAGKVMVVLDLEKAVITDQREFGGAPWSVLVVDDDFMVAGFSGSQAQSSEAVIYVKRGAQVLKRIPGGGGLIRRIPGSQELMTTGGFLRITPSATGADPAVEWSPCAPRFQTYGLPTLLGPRHGLFTAADSSWIAELSRSQLASHRTVGNLEAIRTAIAFPAKNRAVLFGMSGKALTVQVEPFKVVSEVDLGMNIYEAIPDAEGKTAAVFAATVPTRMPREAAPRGDFFRLKLPE